MLGARAERDEYEPEYSGDTGADGQFDDADFINDDGEDPAVDEVPDEVDEAGRAAAGAAEAEDEEEESSEDDEGSGAADRAQSPLPRKQAPVLEFGKNRGGSGLFVFQASTDVKQIFFL